MASPNIVALDASVTRTDLLAQAGVEAVALGLDMAETVGAENSVERSLAHQMAAGHKAALDALSSAALINDPSHRARLLNAASRLMSTFQTGALTLRKLKSKPDQTVVVQHVTLEGGAQAVIGDVHHTSGQRSKS